MDPNPYILMLIATSPRELTPIDYTNPREIGDALAMSWVGISKIKLGYGNCLKSLYVNITRDMLGKNIATDM